MASKLKKFSFLILTAWGLVFLAFPEIASAELYYFRDEHGALHFSNTPDDGRYKSLSSLREEKVKKQGPTGNQFSDFKEIIERMANKYQIDPRLIRALIKVESDFDPYAVSVSGAQGLMQLMPDTARRLEVNDSFNPEDNIEGGAKYMKQLLEMFNGQLIPAVAAYHAGENTVIRYNNQIPPIETTQKYVWKVLTEYYRYHGINITSLKPNKIYRVETVDGDLIYTNRPKALQVKTQEIVYR